MKPRNLLEGVGAALLLFPYYLLFFHPYNHQLYHHGLPVTHLIGGLLVDLLACSIMVTGLLIAVRYIPRPAERFIEALFAGVMLWCIIDLAVQMLIDLHYIVDNQKYRDYLLRYSAIAIPILFGVLAHFLPRVILRAVHAVRLVVASFAFSALWVVPRLIHVALVRQPVEQASSAHLPAPKFGNADRRIVWILFDELSYDQTFDHRASSIQLPNFDRLRARGVSFSSVKPAGFYTDYIIPSLLLGNQIENFRSTIDGQLSYWDEYQHRWLAYDSSATLFGLAKRRGWTTGVDGWYNPYCRVFAPVLDNCYWVPDNVFPMQHYGASEEKSILANALTLPNRYWTVLSQPASSLPDEHIQAYRRSMAHSRALIDDTGLRFVFLHLPAPHPPGIYDRQHHVLRPGGNYLDNLVLADDTLSVLTKEIDASPAAARTILVVTSDHSWRVPLWRPLEDWTDEEERASSGKFDDRPVLLVHFPGQESSRAISTALPEMLEHDIIAGMLLGQIENPEELDAFLMRQDNTQSGKQTVSTLGSGH